MFVLVLLALCLVGAIGSTIWQTVLCSTSAMYLAHDENAWYLYFWANTNDQPSGSDCPAGVAVFLIRFVNFFLLVYQAIPVSL